MKKLLPSLEELIDRYSHQIQLRNPQIPISENGKKLLSQTWQGKEQRLYEKVKDMENKNVKYNNLKKNIKIENFTYLTGIDFLGFPTYTTHQTVFYQNKNFGRQVLKQRQFDHKENYILKIVTSQG